MLQGFHGPHRLAHRVGDLGRAQAAGQAHGDHRALRVGQRLHGPPQALSVHPAERFRGRVGLAGPPEGNSQGLLRPARVQPGEIDGTVARDPVEPRTEPADGALEAAEIPHRRNEHLTEQILRVLPPANLSDQVRQQRAGVRVVELGHCGLVARLGARQRIFEVLHMSGQGIAERADGFALAPGRFYPASSWVGARREWP